MDSERELNLDQRSSSNSGCIRYGSSSISLTSETVLSKCNESALLLPQLLCDVCSFCRKEPTYKRLIYGNKCSKNLGHHIKIFGRHPAVSPEGLAAFQHFLNTHGRRKRCIDIEAQGSTEPVERCCCPRCNVLAMVADPEHINLRSFSPDLFRRDYGTWIAARLRDREAPSGCVAEAIGELSSISSNTHVADEFSSRRPKSKEAKFAFRLGCVLKGVLDWNWKKPDTQDIQWPIAIVDDLIIIFSSLPEYITLEKGELFQLLSHNQMESCPMDEMQTMSNSSADSEGSHYDLYSAVDFHRRTCAVEGMLDLAALQ